MIDEQNPEEEQQETKEVPAEHNIVLPEEGQELASGIGSDAGATTTVHSVSFVPTASEPDPKNTITIQVNYPKDYQGVKYFQDGEKREVSLESAKLFVKKGFAKIIKEK